MGARYIVPERLRFWAERQPWLYLLAYHGNNAAYLISDNGSVWTYVPPGGSTSNSQCTIYGTSGSDSGNNWTYNVSVPFTASYAGASKPIFLQVLDHADQSNGTQQVGTWTVPSNPADNALCSSMSVASTAAPGAAIPFTVTMQNNGTQNWNGRSINASNYMYLGINPWGGGPFGTSIYIDLPGTQQMVYAGQSVTFSSANASASVIAPNTPGTYTFSWMMGHQGGPDWTFGAACSQQVTVQSPPPPTNVSVTPASGSGASQNFTFTASSAGGGANVSQIQALLNWGVWGADGCWVQYYKSSNLLYLSSDDTTQQLGGLAPGAAGAVSNSQCTLNFANSSVAVSGNDLSVTLALSFNPTFIGPQQVLMAAWDNANQNSNWQQMATWTAYAATYSQPPTASVTPTSGTGVSATFTFTTTDLNGAAYIPVEYIYLGSTSGPGCTLVVYHSDNAAYLISDNGSVWTYVPPGGSTSNSQCTISGTSGSDSGNSWIFNVSVAFQPSYAGASKPIYVYTYDHAGQLGGLLQVGTWNMEPPSDFTLSLTPAVSPSIAMAGGSAAAYTVTVNPVAGSGFNSQVTLAANLPPGFTASFGSNPITGGAGQTTMSIFAPAGGTGNITASVTGTSTSPSLAHTATGGIMAIQDFMFTLSSSYPADRISVAAGSTAQWTATVTGLNGFGQPVAITQVQPPIGTTPCGTQVTAPGSITPGPSGTASAPAAVTMPTYSNAQNNAVCVMQLAASYGGTTHFQAGAILITSTGDFIFSTPGQQTASAGGSASFPLAYQPINGFGGTVGFSVTGLPSGATPSFAPFTSGYGSTMTVAVPAGVLAGTYPLTLTGANSSGSISHVVYSSLVVQGGQGFSVTATPITANTVSPGGFAQYRINVNGNYTGMVNLSTSGGPPGASIALSASSARPGGAPVTLTVTTASNTPLSTYVTMVTAMANSVSQYSSAALTVTLPAAASILTPPPGANIAGGNTTFIWNAGLGATQYTLTAVAANGQTSSATTGAGQLSATLSLPASSQTATVTLQTMTSNGALTQTYTYTIQASGTVQTLVMSPGNPTAIVVANGQEVQYTYTYASTGGARPSPQDMVDCEPTDTEAVSIRIVQLTANTATLGFTAARGSGPTAFDWSCDDGGGGGSGGSGTGSTADPTPNIDSITQVPLIVGANPVTITGENFGQVQGWLDIGGTGGCSYSIVSWSGTNGGSDTIQASITASNPGYCTVAVVATTDDSGNSFVPGDGSSSESAAYLVPVTSNEPPAPSVSIFRPCTKNCNLGDSGTDVTNGAATVVIGQLVTLNSLLTGASATNQSWSIPGAVGGYNADVNSGATFPQTQNNLNSTQSSVQFYFAAPTASGMPVTVTYTATAQGCQAPCTATVSFTVVGPTGAAAGTVPSITTTAQGQAGIVLSGNPGQQQVQYGANPPGISFAAVFTDPTGYGLGSVEWIQVVSINDARTTAAGVAQGSVCSGLDAGMPASFPYGVPKDSPLEPLIAGFNSQSDADSFTMWLMYRPALSGAIYVPVAKVSWNWGFQASSSDGGQTWTVTSKTPALVNGQQQPQSQQTSTFPTWASPAIAKTGACAYK